MNRIAAIAAIATARLCGSCRNLRPQPGRKTCRTCMVKIKERTLARRKLNLRAGRCACGRERTDGFRSCASCRERDTTRKRRREVKRFESGLCICCRAHLEDPTKQRCTACLREQAAKHRERVASAAGKTST